jgi:hypothetical protein
VGRRSTGSSGPGGSGFCWGCGSGRSVWPPPPLLAERRGHVPIRWPRPSPLFEGPNRFARKRLWRARARIRGRTLGRLFVLSVGEVARLATLPARPMIGVEAAAARNLAPGRRPHEAGAGGRRTELADVSLVFRWSHKRGPSSGAIALPLVRRTDPRADDGIRTRDPHLGKSGVAMQGRDWQPL